MGIISSTMVMVTVMVTVTAASAIITIVSNNADSTNGAGYHRNGNDSCGNVDFCRRSQQRHNHNVDGHDFRSNQNVTFENRSGQITNRGNGAMNTVNSSMELQQRSRQNHHLNNNYGSHQHDINHNNDNHNSDRRKHNDNRGWRNSH